MKRQNHARRWAILAAVLVLAGCWGGETKYPVSGTVLMDGQPFTKEGFVRVIPANGRASTGAIDPTDGSFVLTSMNEGDGVIPGRHRATVIARVSVGQETASVIDEKYADLNTSGLEVQIDGPTEDLKIELTGGYQAVRRPDASSLIDEGIPTDASGPGNRP